MKEIKVLYIFRGIAGAGKSTTAAKLVGAKNVFAADDYFYHGDEYCYDKFKIAEAHLFCQNNVKAAMKKGIPEIAVANTFIRKVDMKPYKKLASQFGYEVVILTVESDFNNQHNVPLEVLESMKRNFEY